MTCTSPTVPGLDAPTTLLEHGCARPSTNCLANALGNGRAGVDEAVFLGSIGNAAAPGHVVLCDTRTALVREPAAAAGAGGAMTAAAYAAASGFQVLCSVPVALLRRIVALAPADRLDAMRCAGGPLPGIAHMAFGIAGPVPPLPPSSRPGGSSVDQPPAGGRTNDPKATDKSVHDWLDALGGAVPDKDKQALAQTGDDAHALQSWYNSHSRGDPKINSEMPKEVRAAQDRLLANDSTKKQIVDDKNTITRDKIDEFVHGMDLSADRAKDSFNTFRKDHQDADPIASETAVNASILQANEPIVDGGAKNAPLDEKFNLVDLNAVASGDDNKTLADPLKHAAGFFTSPGEFSDLSNAGLDPKDKSDGVVTNSNLDSLVTKGISKSEGSSIADLQSKALQNAVKDAGGDASKVGADYYNGGKSNASGADKADAMLKMGEALGRYRAGEAQYNPVSQTSNPDHYYGDGASPGQKRDDFVKDVQKHIDTLANDPDVAKFMSDKVPAALQGIVSSDPALKGGIEKKLAETSSGKALGDAFGQKGPDGKPLSTTEALNMFAAKPNFYAQALGKTADLSKALQDAPKDVQDKVNTGFDDITSGKEMQRLVDGGMPKDKAVVQSAVNKVAYDSVLDPKKVEDGTTKFNNAAAKMGRAELTDGKSGAELLKGLGITDLNGKGPNSLEAFVNSHLDQFAAPGGQKPKAQDIVAGVRAMADELRNGAKFDDALSKLDKKRDSFLPKGATEPYKAGVLHGASALMLAGGLATRMSTGGGGNPAQTAGQALNVAGLMLEGGGKFYKTTTADLKNQIDADKKRLEDFKSKGLDYKPLEAKIAADSKTLKGLEAVSKDVESAGKTVGGVTGNVLGLVTGAMSAADAAARGDKVGAGLSGTLAGLNGISAITSTAEVVGAVTPRAAELLGTPLSKGATAQLELLAARAGAIGGAVGAVTGAVAIGASIYSIVTEFQQAAKELADKNQWYDQTNQDFNAVKITPPDKDALYSQPNGSAPGSEYDPPTTY